MQVSCFFFSLTDLQPDSKLQFPLTPKGITLNLSSYQHFPNVSRQSCEKAPKNTSGGN